MAKRRQSEVKSSKSMPLITIVVAVLLFGIIGYMVDSMLRPSDNTSQQSKVEVGVFALEDRDGKPYISDDAYVQDLKDFLTEEQRTSGCPDTDVEYVLAANKDKTQVLVRYGCQYDDARKFAVLKDDGWKTISPTNQFDIFGIPSCEMVNTNNIQKNIAPVCWNSGDDSYGVREVLPYVIR